MLAELRYVVRLSLKDLGTSGSAIAALALSIGLTSAMFSILYGSFWKGLPFPDSGRLVRIETLRPGSDGVEWQTIETWEDNKSSLDSVVPWLAIGLVFRGDGRPAEMRYGAYVSSEFFDAVGVPPMIGRGLDAESDIVGAPLSVVLGYQLWMSRFGGDRELIGATVYLESDAATIVGVMPQGFSFPLDQEFWLSLGGILPVVQETTHLKFDVFASLKEGVSAQNAQVELNLRREIIDAGSGTDNDEQDVVVVPFVEAYTRENRRPLWLMAGSALGVLLIGCSNVTNLLLTRWTVRRRELAIRAAFGASQWVLIRFVLFDALALSGLGGIAGVAIAQGGIHLYNASGGLVKAFWVDIRLSPVVLLVMLLVTLLAALLSGLVPALRESRRQNLIMLRDQALGTTGGGVGSIGEWLIGLQVTISCGLLVATLLMVQSVGNLEASDFGEDPDKVWTAQFLLDTTSFPEWRDWLRFYEEFAARAREIPGVSSVSFASHIPAGRTRQVGVEIEGRRYDSDASRPSARWSIVSPDFFNSLGRSVLEGRAFSSSDVVGNTPVVIVNRSFARLHFHTTSPLGQVVRLTDRKFGDIPYVIVGVVPDLYLSWDYFSDQVDGETPQGIYLPSFQHPQPGMYIVIRSDVQSAGLMRQVRDKLSELSIDMPLLQPGTLAGRIDDVTARYRMVRSAFSVFGTAALLLAVTGLFGMVSFIAAQRAREIAIRMALGASPTNIVKLLTGRLGLRVTAGIAAGVGFGLLLSSLLRSFLYDVKSNDPLAMGTVVAVLCLMVVAACCVPTRRSVLLDPASILRGE